MRGPRYHSLRSFVKNSKVTCLVWTVLFLAAAGASGWFVHRRVPTSGAAVIGGLFGGVILIIALSWLLAIPERIAEWLLIVRARLEREPRDGKRIAVIGTLRGNGELNAPFSRERCVLYAYEIVAPTGKAYEGFAMVPLSIEGTTRTRILAKPKMPRLAPTNIDPMRGHMHALDYVESTTFTPATNEEKDLSRTDGHLRVDYAREPRPANIGACRLSEQVLRAGTEVCAIGTYKADRQALVAPVTLRAGSASGIDAAWRVVNATIACAIFAAFAIIAAAVFCANFPIDAAEQSNPQRRLSWWEIDLERFVDKHVRTPLVHAGMLGSHGYRLQALCEGCANGRLEIDGRTIEIRHARYLGDRSVHLSAKPDDRDGITLDGSDRVVLTIGGRSADIPPSWLQPHDIETSLGEDGQYAGRVTVIAPHGGIRCRIAFNTRVDPAAWLTPSPATP